MGISQTFFGRGSALGAPPEAAPGIYFKNMFENQSYLAHPIFKIASWLVLIMKKKHLAGDASYQHSNTSGASHALSIAMNKMLMLGKRQGSSAVGWKP